MIFMAMRQNSLFRPFAMAEKPIMSYSCQEPFAAKDFALFDRLLCTAVAGKHGPDGRPIWPYAAGYMRTNGVMTYYSSYTNLYRITN